MILHPIRPDSFFLSRIIGSYNPTIKIAILSTLLFHYIESSMPDYAAKVNTLRCRVFQYTKILVSFFHNDVIFMQKKKTFHTAFKIFLVIFVIIQGQKGWLHPLVLDILIYWNVKLYTFQWRVFQYIEILIRDFESKLYTIRCRVFQCTEMSSFIPSGVRYFSILKCQAFYSPVSSILLYWSLNLHFCYQLLYSTVSSISIY